MALALCVLLPSAQGQGPSSPPVAPSALEAALRQSTTAYLRGEYREAVEVLEQAFLPQKAIADPELGHLALSSLANLYWLQGRYVQAEAAMRRVVESTRQAAGATHPDVARDLSRLGAVLRAQGRYPEAEAVLWRAVNVVEPAFGVDHAYVADCLVALAELAALQERWELAERRYWRAFMIRSYLFGTDSSPVGEALAGLAPVHEAQGREAEARSTYARALEIATKRPRSHGWGRLDERELRAMNAKERHTVATRGVMSSIEGEHRHLENAQHFEALAALYAAHGRSVDAEALYRRAIAIRIRAFGTEHPQVAQALAAVARLRKGAGDARGALEEARAAAAVLGRRISAWTPDDAQYAQGERRRWRPAFLFLASLLAPSQAPGAFAEGFAALQHALVAAGAEPAASVAEVRSLLGPGEALAIALVSGKDTQVAIVSGEGAELLAAEGGAAGAGEMVRGRLAGYRRAYLIADAGVDGGPAVRLGSMAALRALKAARAGAE